MTTNHHQPLFGPRNQLFKTPVTYHEPFNLANLGIMLAVRAEVTAEWLARGVRPEDNLRAFVEEVHALTLDLCGEFRAETCSGPRGAEIATESELERVRTSSRAIVRRSGRFVAVDASRLERAVRPRLEELPAEHKPARGPSERKPAPKPTERKGKPIAVVDFEKLRKAPGAATAELEGHVAAGRSVVVYWPYDPPMTTWGHLERLGVADKVDQVVTRRPAGRTVTA